MRRRQARRFVLNTPWQAALFRDLRGVDLWAGPFCNPANALALQTLAEMGFAGAFVSPELGREDYLQLPRNSPLPLGFVLSGCWPLCVSRFVADNFKVETLFCQPKDEQAWVKRYGANYWVYPDWKIDFVAFKGELQRAGYALFVHLMEVLPPEIKLKKATWSLELGAGPSLMLRVQVENRPGKQEG